MKTIPHSIYSDIKMLILDIIINTRYWWNRRRWQKAQLSKHNKRLTEYKDRFKF